MASPPRLVVPSGNRRTLTALVRDLVEVSNRDARTLIAQRRVQVDGATIIDPVHRPPGDAVVEVLDRPERRAEAVDGTALLSGPGFRVIYEDDALVAVDKDSGVLTIPTSDREDDEPPLVARVAAALSLSGRRGRSLWVVHRIDRETSGLVLFARSERAYETLREAFMERRPKREYLAWTEGVPKDAAGTLRHLLAESRHPRWRRMEVVGSQDPNGRLAVMRYRVEASRRRPDHARLRVELDTGRRNQIRVQLAEEGLPLVGDRYYGARTEGPGRTALHAARLVVTHPFTGRSLELACAVPEDLTRLDERLFGGGSAAR